MTAVPNNTIAAMVEWIDRHLDEALTLEVIADRAGYSPFHFSRLFLAATRRSVMAHVRGRRLVRGARRLLTDPHLPLVELAFECGFDSQEAFTRAFKRMFGTTPARFRHGFSVEPLEGQFPMHGSLNQAMTVEALPDLVPRGRFTVAGQTRRFDEASKADIPQLWSKLIGRLPLPGQVDSRATYGVVWSVDHAEGSFHYMAGVEVSEGSRPADGFETLTIEPATYAVFRITLDGGPIHLQVKAAMAEIWGQLIPAAGLKPSGAPDFELYPGDQALTEPGALIDFYVPVA